MDEWADIPDFPGYQINKIGQVKRLARTVFRRMRLDGQPDLLPIPEVILKGTVTPAGYIKYCINERGHVRMIAAHRAVLLAFVGPCPDGMDACHNNGISTDNRLENLRWDTRRSNTIDKIDHGNHPFAGRTHCNNGHEFTDENTRVDINNDGKWTTRKCRACQREAQRRYRSRRAAIDVSSGTTSG